MLDAESARLLALPPPSEILGPEQARWRRWLAHTMWVYRTALRVALRTPPGAYVAQRKRPAAWTVSARWRTGTRVLRSSLLALKVLSLTRACRDPVGCPRGGAIALLLAAALADTAIDHEQFYDAREGRALQKGGSAGHRSSKERRKKAQRAAVKSLWITAGLTVLHVAVLGLNGVRWSNLRWR